MQLHVVFSRLKKFACVVIAVNGLALWLHLFNCPYIWSIFGALEDELENIAIELTLELLEEAAAGTVLLESNVDGVVNCDVDAF
jgi:hypothetical protein